MTHMLDNNKIHSHTMEVVGTHFNSSSRVLGDSHSLVGVVDRGLNLSFRCGYCRLVDHVARMFVYVLSRAMGPSAFHGTPGMMTFCLRGRSLLMLML